MASEMEVSVSSTTGIIYEESMADYSCLFDPEYVENPDRFRRVLARCREYGLIERCLDLRPRDATDEEILSNHSQEIVEYLKRLEGVDDPERLKEMSRKWDCCYLHPNVYRLAKLSAGCAVQLTDSVLSGKIKNGFGILRPPGHHAMFDEICGYCYFNNVAICARHALAKGVKKILIVDWDVHHGQGTQRAFYDDPRVLYFSIHRYEFGAFWPELRESDFDHVGSGAGAGFNVNIPLNTQGHDDSDYLAAFLEVLMPVACEFAPELVLISAGFDPAIGCPEGEQEVSPSGFTHLANLVQPLANGRVVALLEGGYCLTSLAEGAALTVKTLLGDPCTRLPSPLGPPRKEMADAIRNAKIALRPYWRCFQDSVPAEWMAETKWLGPEGERPTEYDPMCPTPPRSKEVEEGFEKKLQCLIACQEMAVPEFKLAVCCEIESLYEFCSDLWDLGRVTRWTSTPAVVEQIEWLKIHGFNLEGDRRTRNNVGAVFKVVDQVISGKCQGGIAVVELGTIEVNTLAAFYAEQKHGIGKTVNIWIDCEPEFNKSGGLKINVSPRRPRRQFDDMLDIEVKSDQDGNSKDREVVLSIFTDILPRCYEYDPDMVFVHYPLSSGLISESGAAALLHHLSALAGGKLVVVFEAENGDVVFDNRKVVREATKSLCKLPFKMPKFDHPFC